MCEEVNFRCINCERFPEECRGQSGTFYPEACPNYEEYQAVNIETEKCEREGRELELSKEEAIGVISK